MFWCSLVGRMIGCGKTSGVRLPAGVEIFLCAPTYRNAVGVSLLCNGTEGYFLEYSSRNVELTFIFRGLKIRKY
jgi:hypothetical protein